MPRTGCEAGIGQNLALKGNGWQNRFKKFF